MFGNNDTNTRFMITREHTEVARKNWLKASLSLSFKLVTPYFVEINGNKLEVFAFLPAYGSQKGTLICLTSPPHFKTDKKIVNWAKENNINYSFINIEDFQSYNENYIKEILEDWVV